MSKNYNLNILIQNNSNIITNDEIYECLFLLPKEYEIITTTLFIHKNLLEYFNYIKQNHGFLFWCYEKVMLHGEDDLEKIVAKDGMTLTLGRFNVIKNEIHLIEDRSIATLVQFKKLLPEKLTDEIFEKNKNGWVKYLLIYSLIHELNHILQYIKDKDMLKKSKRNTPWNSLQYEIDSVKMSEEIYKNNNESICRILNCNGVRYYHEFEPKLMLSLRFELDDLANKTN